MLIIFCRNTDLRIGFLFLIFKKRGFLLGKKNNRFLMDVHDINEHEMVNCVSWFPCFLSPDIKYVFFGESSEG